MPKYVARPVEVEAKRIERVAGASDKGNDVFILEDGSEFTADEGMIARFPDAGEGDYVVTQADGYVYLNPKDVFERKYEPPKDNSQLSYRRGSQVVDAIRYGADFIERNDEGAEQGILITGGAGSVVRVQCLGDETSFMEGIALTRLGEQVLINAVMPNGNDAD